MPKQLTKKHAMFGIATRRSGGKCEARLVTSWDNINETTSCGRPMEGEFLLDDGSVLCYCRPCRMAAVGMLSSEKRKRTIAKKAAQENWLPPQFQKKVERT